MRAPPEAKFIPLMLYCYGSLDQMNSLQEKEKVVDFSSNPLPWLTKKPSLKKKGNVNFN